MELQPLKRLFIVTSLAGALVATLAVGAAAKEPQDYGLLRIHITGAADAERSFVAVSSEDRQNAGYLVSELGMVTSADVVSAGPPALSAYYRIAVTQEANVKPPLPWSSLPSVEFYYYPGQGGVGFLRSRAGTGSRPDHEFWLVAFPAVQSLLEPRLDGLAPMQALLPALPLTKATPSPLAVSGLAFLALTLLVSAITLLHHRWSPAARQRERTPHPSLPG